MWSGMPSVPVAVWAEAWAGAGGGGGGTAPVWSVWGTLSCVMTMSPLSRIRRAASYDHPQHFFQGRVAGERLDEPVQAKGAHALFDGHTLHRNDGLLLDDHALDLLGHRHDLAEDHPAVVTGVRAGPASVGAPEGGGVELLQVRLLVAGGEEVCGRRVERRLALRAEHAGQSLGEHAGHRRGDEERFDPHLGEPERG